MFARWLEVDIILLIPKSPTLITPSFVRNMFAVFKSLDRDENTFVRLGSCVYDNIGK